MAFLHPLELFAADDDEGDEVDEEEDEPAPTAKANGDVSGLPIVVIVAGIPFTTADEDGDVAVDLNSA